jgi:hypothetical protein
VWVVAYQSFVVSYSVAICMVLMADRKGILAHRISVCVTKDKRSLHYDCV